MLAVVVLVPTAGMAVLAASTAAPRWSERATSAGVSREALAMQQLIAFRGKVTTENVYSAALRVRRRIRIEPCPTLRTVWRRLRGSC